MSRICALTGKKALTGNNVSHANNKTKRRQYANIHDKKIFIPELGKTVKVRMSTSAMRTVNKIGFMNFLRKNNLELKDVTKNV